MLAPLTSQEVCMRFSFLDEGLTSEYEETITVITDDFGMVNLNTYECYKVLREVFNL